ncbi:MAG: AAA-like domain-containing protein [Byssovorax sp.]
MVPYFNTSGVCNPGEHYMLPPERRLGRMLALIEQGRYFTLHAGHQTGKTTSARWLVRHFNTGDRYRAVWVDLQMAREQPDPASAFRTMLNELDMAIRRSLPDIGIPAERDRFLDDPPSALRRYLGDVAARCPYPLIVLFDEVDGLVGDAMVSFLTQLRAGYMARSESPFPRSVVLVGRRVVRDYILTSDQRNAVAWLGTTSPFNISAEATTIGPFTEAEVAELCAQHTDKTGQAFLPEATARIYALSQGHPWLVNALAAQIVEQDVCDRSVAVTAAHVDAAKETIILERRSHIDSLIHKLREPRVRRILDPMLVGGRIVSDEIDDDLAYTRGLGIVRVSGGHVEIANPIYREVIPRVLSYGQQVQIAAEPSAFVRADGALDVPKLMSAFQTFWRKDGHLAAGGFTYTEAGPHLMLMAFLQRVVNGGGQVEREYGLGRGALDLLVSFHGERHAIEVKLRRSTETEREALAQVASYLDVLGLSEGYLVMFDLRSKRSWKEKLFVKERKVHKKRVHLVGC